MTDELDRSKMYEVVIVVNGGAPMSPGKLAGQAYQAAMRASRTRPSYIHSNYAWQRWFEEGTRTIIKVAKTQKVFNRICNEVPGFVMVDEGHTEVEPDTATLLVTGPFVHEHRPAILDRKASML